MPQALVDRIFESLDKEIDFMPLVKMWTRWLRNPILWRKMKQGHGEDFCNRFFNFVNMQYVHPKHKEDLMENHSTNMHWVYEYVMYLTAVESNILKAANVKPLNA